jgi:hypothetical protein
MPLTELLSASVRSAEAGRIVAAELEQDRLAVKLARSRQPVAGTLVGNTAIEKAHLFKHPDRPANLRFGESKVRPVGQLAPVNRKGGHKPDRRGPEPTQEHGQREGCVSIAGGSKSQDQPIPHVMRESVRSSIARGCKRTA